MGTNLGGWSLLLLLLGLVIPPASTQALSYEKAILRAVDAFNEDSSDPNLYRFLELDQEPTGDEDPNIPQPVSFLVKETVCSKTVQMPLQQCDFKEDGLVQRCMGTVILDQVTGSFDINCEKLQQVGLGGFLKRGAQKIRRRLGRIGRRIKDFLRNLRPRQVRLDETLESKK
ncbi:cathelicidin antimicrobial peptide-like [Sorex fumeus]|uniref:cathelicidin antimicrobial peptide-like n=1 Tax=Sorex fumeus TaxID=62283 RepID=UPI0024ADE398|nr:cathelicidin antimicrobial peptide-like [Sorex fumeus]